MTDVDAAVDHAADEIYGLTLERFTSRRNELAKALRKEGNRSAAEAVKALRKPNQTAWALNQVARRRAGDVERLLEAGAQLRRAQEAVLSGDDPRALATASEEERRVVSDVVDAAASIASEGGVGATDSLRERVRSTLEAAVRDAEVGETLRAGRLVGDHQAVGLLDPSVWRPSAEESARRERRPRRARARRLEESRTRRAGSRRSPQSPTGEKAAREKSEADRAKRIEETRQQLEAAQQRRGAAGERLEEATSAATEALQRAKQASEEAEKAEETLREKQAEVDNAEAEKRRLEKELAHAERRKQ